MKWAVRNIGEVMCCCNRRNNWNQNRNSGCGCGCGCGCENPFTNVCWSNTCSSVVQSDFINTF